MRLNKGFQPLTIANIWLLIIFTEPLCTLQNAIKSLWQSRGGRHFPATGAAPAPAPSCGLGGALPAAIGSCRTENSLAKLQTSSASPQISRKNDPMQTREHSSHHQNQTCSQERFCHGQAAGLSLQAWGRLSDSTNPPTTPQPRSLSLASWHPSGRREWPWSSLWPQAGHVGAGHAPGMLVRLHRLRHGFVRLT